MGRNIWSYTNDFADSTLHAERIHLTIEVGRGHTTLEDITQDQCTTTLVIYTTRHEVERNIQGVDVRIIRVVNKRTAMLSFFHLQSHGNGFELCHTLA